MSVLKWVVAIIISFLLGKLVSKIKLPSLLGWLIGGMLFGPYALNLISEELISSGYYEHILKVLECAVGFMIGTELVIKKLKSSGRALIMTTIFQSVGTYLFVTSVFFILFKIMDIPTYTAFVFGSIALATAPAPALSIVQEFKTRGPVTDTLIPMAALDDVVGVIFFFCTIAFVVMKNSGAKLSFGIVPIMIFLPMSIGLVTGIIAGKLLNKYRSENKIIAILIGTVLFSSAIGFYVNENLLPAPILNFMLIGMSFSAVFSNMLEERYLLKVIKTFEPILGISLVIVIVNLGVPLDYKSIFGAGLFTAIYIVSRGVGKYFGARIGSKICMMPETVQKYLGLTLLPHSGVSLVFTGIAVSVLLKFAPEEAQIIQGTIAAAAIINEIIAVVVAKKAFEWAGEID